MTKQSKKIKLFTKFIFPFLICTSSYADMTPDAISSYRRFNDYTYIRADFGAIVDSIDAGNSHYPLLAGGDFGAAPIYSVGAGYNYEGPLRTDINIQYRGPLRYKHSNGTESVKQKTKNFVVFWNGYIDGENDSIVTPYVTGGIGYSRLFTGPAYSSTNSGVTASFGGRTTDNFAWNVGAGAKMKVTDNAELDLTYRFVTLGKVKFDDSYGIFGVTRAGKSLTLRTHEITLGLVYSF